MITLKKKNYVRNTISHTQALPSQVSHGLFLHY